MLASLRIALTLSAAALAATAGQAEAARAAYSATELSDRGTASPSGAQSVRATSEIPEVHDSALPEYSTRRRPRWRLILLCAVIVLAVGGGAALVSHDLGVRKPGAAASSGTSQTTLQRKPRAVVQAYFAAINAHDWRKVWDLGGKNLDSSCTSMIAGFRETRRDVITRMTGDGDAVAVRIRAYETTGAMQVYALSYTVTGGVIASGHQSLIATYSQCPHIKYGADGTAGPLFCADGQPNPPVLSFYQKLHLHVLSLGSDATRAQVLRAMCADVHQHSTYPTETDAYKLAQKINGWSFAISPPQEMVDGACN